MALLSFVQADHLKVNFLGEVCLWWNQSFPLGIA